MKTLNEIINSRVSNKLTHEQKIKNKKTSRRNFNKFTVYEIL